MKRLAAMLSRDKRMANFPSVRDPPLHAAAEAGQLACAKLLIDHGADVNAHAAFDETPLSRAVEHGHIGIVELLIKHGAAVDGASRGTLLAAAVGSRDLRILNALLKAGADPNRKPDRGETPLAVALRRGDLATLDLLASKGARTDGCPMEAAANGGLESVRWLMKHGCEPTAADLDGEAPQGADARARRVVAVVAARRAASAAVRTGSIADLDAALAVSPSTLQLWGGGMLDDAIREGRTEFVDALLRRGVKPHDRSIEEARGRVEIVRALIKAGAPVRGRTLSPLHNAVSSGYVDVVRELVAAGVKPDERDWTGKTALELVAQHPDEGVRAQLTSALGR